MIKAVETHTWTTKKGGSIAVELGDQIVAITVVEVVKGRVTLRIAAPLGATFRPLEVDTPDSECKNNLGK